MENIEPLISRIFFNKDVLELVTAIVLSGIVIGVGAWMKSFISGIIALIKIKSSFNISQNEIFRFDTTTGYKYFMLSNINRKRVTFIGSKTELSIPTTIFLAMSWEKVKKNINDYEDAEFFNKPQ